MKMRTAISRVSDRKVEGAIAIAAGGAKAVRADRTALIFPSAGSHWPGMADDLDARPEGRELIDRADAALAELGVPQHKLRKLMAGEDQAVRTLRDGEWEWSGDYPLSAAAQTAVSVAHAEHFVAAHGEPATLIAESMGEFAAYCVAGVFDFETAVQTTYRWAQALERSSASAGDLRLALLVMCNREDAFAICEEHEGAIVIYESVNQFAVSVPRSRIRELEARAVKSGARALVSVQPCTAHDARLAQDRDTWDSYGAWVRSLRFHRPHLEIHSTLEPGLLLGDPAALEHNLLATGTSVIHWAETISRLFWSADERPIDRLLQVCSRSDPYVLDRLRPQGIVIRGVRTEAVATLADVERGGRRK